MKSHEIHIVVLLGAKLSLISTELRSSIWSKRSVFFILFGVTVFALFDPVGIKSAPLWAILVFWLVVFIAYLFSIFLTVEALAKLAEFRGQITIHSLFLTLIELLLMLVIIRITTWYIDAIPRNAFIMFEGYSHFLYRLPFYFVGMELFASAFLYYVLPPIINDIRPKPKREQQNKKPVVAEFAGFVVALDDLLYVSASEHYLEFFTGDGKTHLVRGRMRDFVEAMDERNGIKIHRSIWISRQSIHTVKTNSTASDITLKNGQTLRTSRGENQSVLNWLAKFLTEIDV